MESRASPNPADRTFRDKTHADPLSVRVRNSRPLATSQSVGPYTYGPYFDALRDECRRKARETLEARERAKEYAVISPLKERPKMNEEVLNTSLRKFLKTVGVASQREIEKAIRTAVADGRLKGNETLSAQMVLTIGKVGLNHKMEGTIELD